MLHVLFLSVWYPHRYDAMAGLFVRKHALAVSRYARVTVLYLHEDDRISKIEIIDLTTESVREIYVYYPKSHFPHISYRRAFKRGWKYVTEHCGKPDITHVSVLGKQAVSAYRLWRRYGIPYVITEHWTGYTENNFKYKGWLRKRMTELVVRNAKCIMPVSKHLADRMKFLGLKGNYCVVRNVVDDFFYTPYDKKTQSDGKIRLLHVSCFDDDAKNVTGLLKAIADLRKRRNDFMLTLVGTGQDFDMCKDCARQLQIEDTCLFTGELTPEQVAEQMFCHDVFVMFSNFENAPVVISEALAVGIPTVSSNVGGIPEMITATEGILVAPRDVEALTNALDTMCDTYMQYDKDKIRRQGELYSFEKVGKEIFEKYNRYCGIRSVDFPTD